MSDNPNTTVPSEPAKEGWFGPATSRAYHYFGEDGHSLCGKWLQLQTPPSLGYDWDIALGPATKDCKTCKTKLAARETA